MSTIRNYKHSDVGVETGTRLRQALLVYLGLIFMKHYIYHIRRAWELLKPFHIWLYATLALTFIMQGLTVYLSVNTSNILNYLSANNIQSALYLVGVFLVVSFMRNIAQYEQDKIFYLKLDQNILQYMKDISFRAVLRLNISQQIEDHSLIRKHTTDEGEMALKEVVNVVLNDLIPVLFMVIFSLGTLFYYSPMVGAISSTSFIILLIWAYKFAEYHKPFVEQVRKAWQESIKVMTEAFQHMTLVKEFSQENYFTKKMLAYRQKNVDFYIDTWMKSTRNANYRNYFTDLSEMFSILAAVFLFASGNIEIGLVYLVFTLNGRAYSQIGNITKSIRNIPIHIGKIEKYFELIDKPVDFDESGIKKFTIGDIVFKDVTFKYPKGEHNVLDKFSLHIKQGQKVALIGHSGNGKTTLSRLLMRAYAYREGSITVGGHELSTLDTHELRHHIGYVSQHVELFDDTVKENILFGVREKDLKRAEKKLNEIAKLARITEFYDRLGSKKLNQFVGEKGVKLSGGERQRIGIARAIIKDPEILIFDEATASLDAQNERYIKESIDEVAKGKTTIIIAHRLSTIIGCDAIHIVDKGRVIASGTHQELLADSEFYRTLINSQEIEK